MDFDYTEEQQAIAALTEQIVGDKVDHTSLKALEAAGEEIDRDTWAALAEAGVIGATLPEDHGGAGLGFLAATAAAEVIGRHAARLPLVWTVVAVGLPVAAHGTEPLQQRVLGGIASGERIATASLAAQPGITPLTATADGKGWILDGSRTCVPLGTVASLALVTARTADGDEVVLAVDLDRDGVAITPIETTTGATEATVTFEGVVVDEHDQLGGPDVADWIRLRVGAAIAAQLTGACEAALGLASDYAKQRQQFDRAIATFQAVSQRAGDAYIDTEAVRLTAHQAAWRIDAGLPAAREVAIARWWAAEAGCRVVHAATHLHGGVGVDRDYPLHRYFLMARQLELTLGNAETQLEALGELIAQ